MPSARWSSAMGARANCTMARGCASYAKHTTYGHALVAAPGWTWGTPYASIRQTSRGKPRTCASRRHRNPSRRAWRRGALGVPRPAPGQPQGRAPTGALLFGVEVNAERTMVIRDGCARQSDHGAELRAVRQTRNVGARPCGCPGAVRGTPDASIRQTSRGTPGTCASWWRNPSRTSRRDGALGVPHPAPGQPQGRAPTGAWSTRGICRTIPVHVVSERRRDRHPGVESMVYGLGH